jgi:hypothetical protein
MASKYPNALDDTSNLPTIRNGLTDVSADTFNRLRDAILAVERSIGINPQGQFSDLASRLAVIINPDGSLSKQAFQAIGGIFGPIRSDDIDQNAAIPESKLHLNFSTALLQDEIRIVEARTMGLVDLILSAQARIQEHISLATGAHRAAAIATDMQTSPIQSSTATVKIDQPNVQAVLQQLYSNHINFYSGVDSNLLTLTNSPHQANQIFYDNRNTELPTNSVQGAIDNMHAAGNSSITQHQRQLHSNGIQRRIESFDDTNSSGIARGRIILSGFTARVSYPSTNASGTSIFIDIPIQQGGTTTGVSLVITNTDGTTELVPIDVDDSLHITDPLGNTYALLPITDLEVRPFVDPITNIATNYLVGVDVFYNPDVFSALFSANGIVGNNPILQVVCSVYKKIDVQGNENALNCIARVLKPNSISEPNLSSSVSEIQIAHPNAATIVSKGFNPSALGRRPDGYFDRNFSSILTIVVDGLTHQVQIVPNSPVDITLDSCVSKANLEFLKQNIPISAYRLGQEMALSHDWPDDIFIAGIQHTIRVLSGGGVDASAAAGFSYIANTTVYGSAGNSFIINGVQRSTFRIKIPLQGTAALGKGGFALFGNVIVLNDPNNNPLVAGVRIGDIVNLQGLTSLSTSARLDGIRRVASLSVDTITVDGDPYPVDVQLSNSATLVVYSNVVSLDGLAHKLQTDFAGLDPNLSQNAVVQVFMNSAGETDFHERLIYPNAATVSGAPYGGPSLLPLTNLTTDTHGVYIIDCNRGLEGSPQGIRRLVSFQFDNKKRVFATFGCQASPTDGYAISTSLTGPSVNITADGHYQLIDETGLNFITLQSVKAFNLLSDTILSTIPDGRLLTYVLPIVKFEEINEFENLLLCNVYYNSQVNQIPLLNGELALFDKRYTGTMGAEQIRDDVVEKYISGPFGETRGDGVAAGLFVPSDPTATQNITNDKVVYVNGGVVYVQGVRYEISSQQIYVDPSTLDISQYGTDGYFPGTGKLPSGDATFKNGYIRYYVFVDNFGRLQTTSRLSLPASLPFVPLAKVVLTTHGLLNNSPNIISVNVVDFRLFINRVDDKIDITVSSIPQQPAHFNSITAAVEYIDNMRYNDAITNTNLHIRPMTILLREGTYQEATSVELPPLVTLRGESAHGVRIRPPVNLLGRNIAANIQVDDTANNQFVFNVNMLPEGTCAKIENICFDLNTSTTPGSLPVPGKVGAIKITWFNNTATNNPTSNVKNTTPQLATTPSVVDIKGCLFILDGLVQSIGIQNVFSVSTPLITGGLQKFSYSYSQLYSKIHFSNYHFYRAAPYAIPSATTQTTPPPPVSQIPPVHTATLPSPSFEPGPNINSVPPSSINTSPHAPFSPEDAVFTDSNAIQLGFNHGGIVNIENNVFMITDGFRSICIDRFYDTTTAAGFASAQPIPVSNTRMKGFKVVGNSFNYNGSLLSQSLISPTLTGMIPTVTPANTATGQAGQEALRNQIYDLMIHKELRGWTPSMYPNGRLYPDPKDGYGVVDGYWVPPAGGKVTEFMVIDNNMPTGLNLPSASPIGFMSETQDSVARDNHGGGTKFGTFTVPTNGTPLIIDRSMDWHDRYVWAYGNNTLTDVTSSSKVANKVYTTQPPNQNIWSGISFTQNAGIVSGQTSDQVMSDYGANVSSHGFTFGRVARYSGDLVSIKHPINTQLPGWSHLKYLGAFSLPQSTGDYSVTVAIVVMPTGELAVIHAGLQSPTGNNTKLIQTSDSYPTSPGSDPSRANTTPIVLSLVIQYSPKINVLTTSQFDANTGLNTLDNIGKGWGKV